MTRHLLLLRHAKSSWSDPAVEDIARPLAPRGERAAAAMGRMMAARDLLPDRVLCSPAIRARQTLDLVTRDWPRPVETEIVPGLYDFGDGEALLAAIRQDGGDARRLLLIGHNPSMEALAHRLVTRGDRTLRARMSEKFPTCALAEIVLECISWSDLAESAGTLTRFIRPRDLED